MEREWELCEHWDNDKRKTNLLFSFLFWVIWKDKITRVHLLVSHQANEWIMKMGVQLIYDLSKENENNGKVKIMVEKSNKILFINHKDKLIRMLSVQLWCLAKNWMNEWMNGDVT